SFPIASRKPVGVVSPGPDSRWPASNREMGSGERAYRTRRFASGSTAALPHCGRAPPVRLAVAAGSAADDGADDAQRLCAGEHGGRQGLVRRPVRKVLTAGEKAQERSADPRSLVAD